MAEIPSNILLAEKFAQHFDGFSIPSTGLNQLVLGACRDSTLLASSNDERSEAVRRMIQNLVKSAHRAGSKVCVCGQAPGDTLELAGFLVEMGVDAISVNPESVIKMKKVIAEKEQERRRSAHPV
jgi:pyruvate,water dikinase